MDAEYLFSVDPGAQAAFAFWRRGVKLPIATYQIIPPKRMEWADRVRTVCDEMEEAARYALAQASSHPVCYMEYPALMPGGGEATARRGDLVKLAVACGQLARMFEGELHVMVTWVPVAAWKGQMSKEAVKARIARRLGGACPKYKEHVWDAVGIGLDAQGRF